MEIKRFIFMPFILCKNNHLKSSESGVLDTVLVYYSLSFLVNNLFCRANMWILILT